MKKNFAIEFDVILLAAGKGERTRFQKQFAIIGKLPIWQIALDNIRFHSACHSVIVVFPPKTNINQTFFNENPQINWVYGGDTRSASVWNALKFRSKLPSKKPYVAIHDAARPILPSAVLERLIEKLQIGEKAVIPVLDTIDTIKKFDGVHVSETLKRNELVSAQTPQIFKTEIIEDSYKNLFMGTQSQNILKKEFYASDDSSLVERNGIKVAMVVGSPKLQKITFKEDLILLKQLLETNYETRVATGYDVHKFRPWDTSEKRHSIKICGVEIDHEFAIEAHSDGDVGIHALCDAIFGCLADGDIGTHFPPSNKKWKDANSETFLKYALKKVENADAKINFIDITIICEMPRIGPNREKMIMRLAKICNMQTQGISIKATTSERLGFTGRKEGLSAIATVTMSVAAMNNRELNNEFFNT